MSPRRTTEATLWVNFAHIVLMSRAMSLRADKAMDRLAQQVRKLARRADLEQQCNGSLDRVRDELLDELAPILFRLQGEPQTRATAEIFLWELFAEAVSLGRQIAPDHLRERGLVFEALTAALAAEVGAAIKGGLIEAVRPYLVARLDVVTVIGGLVAPPRGMPGTIH
jgi:hypothetical protein